MGLGVRRSFCGPRSVNTAIVLVGLFVVTTTTTGHVWLIYVVVSIAVFVVALFFSIVICFCWLDRFTVLLKLLLRVSLDLWVSIFSWFGLLFLIDIEPVYVVKEVKFEIGGDNAFVKQDRDVSCLARQDQRTAECEVFSI